MRSKRVSRAARRGSLGQTIIIAAMASTMLIGVVGLAVDGGAAYQSAAAAERAATAASLAGATDMPNWNYSATGASAWQQAYATAQINGYAVSGGSALRISA